MELVWTLERDLVINNGELKSQIIDLTRSPVAADNPLFSSFVFCFSVCKKTNWCSLVGYIVVYHSINMDFIIIPHEWHDIGCCCHGDLRLCHFLVGILTLFEHIFTCKIINIKVLKWKYKNKILVKIFIFSYDSVIYRHIVASVNSTKSIFE